MQLQNIIAQVPDVNIMVVPELQPQEKEKITSTPVPKRLPIEQKLVVILVGVFLRDMLGELHPHLVGVVPAEHIADPCNFRLHGNLHS